MFFSVKLGYTLMKKMPRVLVILNSLISIFLLIFLLVGCYKPNQSSTYLVRYKFNDDSPLYSVISKQFSSKPSTKGLEKVNILSGYMGVCIDDIPSNYYKNATDKASTVCFNRKKVDDMQIYDDLTIKIFSFGYQNSSKQTDSSDINILGLAHQNSAEIVHPYILMVVVIFTILLFGITTYAAIPKLPYKDYTQRVLMGLTALTAFLWTIGAIWAHVAINASASLVPRASMNIMKVHKGRKSQTMTWFAFAFMLINCFIIWMIYFRDRKELDEKLDDVKSVGNPFSNKYSSDSNTLTSV